MENGEQTLNKRVISLSGVRAMESNLAADIEPDQEYEVRVVVSLKTAEKVYNGDGTYDLNFKCAPVSFAQVVKKTIEQAR